MLSLYYHHLFQLLKQITVYSSTQDENWDDDDTINVSLFIIISRVMFWLLMSVIEDDILGIIQGIRKTLFNSHSSNPFSNFYSSLYGNDKHPEIPKLCIKNFAR